FMIGHIVSKLSMGAMPVAGATVAPQGSAADKVTVIYPNATFTAPGTSTSATGLFLVIPKAGIGTDGGTAAVVATWTVTPPSGDTRVWGSFTAGSNPGSAFVILVPANETP